MSFLKQKESAIKVAIVGANGKMGQLACESIASMSGYAIVTKVGSSDDLDSVLKQTKPDIAIELTSNLSVLKNTQIIIQNGVRPVVGSSGLLANQVDELAKLCKAQGLGGLIIPNFSLGIACVNKLASTLKEHFADFSVVEFHHTKKKDKPSGTARYMTQMLGVDESEIASIRSDGFLAKLQVYANSPHERIIIDHESFDRNSFHAGICLSIKKVTELTELVVGLENML